MHGADLSHCPARDSGGRLVVPTVDVAFQVRCVGGFAYQHWSPDGYQLFYMDETGATRMLAAGAIERSSSRWSPDGSRLAFVQTVAGNTDLYVVRPDGTGLARLTNHPDSASSPSWSPDGERIAFRTLGTDGRWSLWTIRADGADRRRIASGIPAGSVTGPEWSPRGDAILFTSSVDGFIPVQLWSIAPDGTNRRSLASASPENVAPVWSPDGARIAYLFAGSGGWELRIMNADGTGARTIATSQQAGISPAWSPDGKRIAFVKHDGRNYGVYTLDVDGGTGERPLTSQLWTAFDPAWSLDGRHLLFPGIPKFVTAVMVMDADGSGVQVLNLSSDPDETPRVRPR
ncbi:MAG: PD40 domain-containing protein [Gemmatimonadetes bacterium]|nr:PD40 domain-containing protein [Gemmatimonadota bacterium]